MRLTAATSSVIFFNGGETSFHDLVLIHVYAPRHSFLQHHRGRGFAPVNRSLLACSHIAVMRLATQALRDVRLKRLVLGSKVPLLLLYLPCYLDSINRSVARAGYSIRLFSASPSFRSAADYDLINLELSYTSKAIVKPGIASQQTTGSSLVQETKAFHKWSALLTDPGRLAVESDFRRRGPANNWQSRLLVDKPENRKDMTLWACLLDYQMRINGTAGVINVWKALWGRKALYDVDNPLAKMFWRVLLEGVLLSDDRSILEGVWIYSEWMYDTHQVKWPQLYTTVISHLLRTHRHREVLQWQLRLAPNFYPGPDQFAKIVKEFALDKELYRLDTLPSLYKISPDKSLYSTLLPYLFDLGESNLARAWRRVFVRHGEAPQTPAPVRPLLRFMRGYHPMDTLTSEELAALKFTVEPTKDEDPDLSREFMNRVHGRTFGITVKNYNDGIGARWFATSWVSLDLAISTIVALGIQKIGPLSLQSIALRAGNSKNVLDRISQLRDHGISVIESNYLQLVLYLARKNDDELLDDLLQSDFHPDVFDDLELQTRLVDSATNASDWRTLRLLLVSRLVAFEQSARQIANSVLRFHFEQRNPDGVVQVLEDMKLRNIPLNVEEATHIYESLIDDYTHSTRGLTSQPAAFYLSVFRQLKSMDVPVPLNHWRLLILSMVRRGRLDDLERFSIELVEMFLSEPSMRPGFVPLHVWDLPEAMKSPLEGVENLLGVYIPQDLPAAHIHHPLRELFNNKVITEMIEKAFITHPGQGFRTKHNTQAQGGHSQAEHIMRVIRLLRLLHERGMWIRFRKIEFAVTNCLVNIYGLNRPRDNAQRLMRANNTLALTEMKKIVDSAWGDELLPPLDKLREIIRRRPTAAPPDRHDLPHPAEYENEGRD